MRSDVAIAVRDLTKKYRIFGSPGDRIKQAFTFGKVSFHREFTALRDISFEIKRGEAVGILGRNGSGKSTLLQLICGILKPTSGTVGVNGRISALLELGAGFNPEFTGRENVYFQGAVIGMTREQVDRRFDDIVVFADIGDFIDQPVRTYSSGMFVRLAFAVAVHVEPEILIVDEALAVGDVAFQMKCMNKIQQLLDSGVTFLFVSHNMYQVRRLCTRAIYLKDRRVAAIGPVGEVTDAYEADLPQEEGAIAQPTAQSSDFRFVSVTLESDGSESHRQSTTILERAEFNVRIEYEILKNLKDGLQIGLILKTRDGQRIFGLTSMLDGICPPSTAGKHVAKVHFSPNLLLPDHYLIGVSAFDQEYKNQYGFWEPACLFRIASHASNGLHAVGTVALPRHWVIESTARV